MANYCVACGEAVLGAPLCLTDRVAMSEKLMTVPEIMRELETTLTRQARTGGESAGRRGTETPNPFHIGASEVLDRLKSTLKALGTYPLTKSKIDAFVAARQRALIAIDTPLPSVYVGRCEDCQANIYARPDEFTTFCVCGAEYRVAPLDVEAELAHLSGSASEVRAWLVMLGYQRSISTVRRATGKLEPVEVIGGISYYSLNEVMRELKLNKREEVAA